MTNISPSNIVSLNENEVFVFGSNLSGWHLGGAALYAMKKFGAIFGKGVGIQGQSYAIPTLFSDDQSVLGQLSIATIDDYVNDFIDYAITHPDKKFYVTAIGCGIAGFSENEIAPLFKSAINVDNIYLPQLFVDIIEG